MAKSMLRKNDDIFSGLLIDRSTPLQNGYSPSDLLTGHHLQTQLPTLPANLYPNVQANNHQWIEEKENFYQSNQQHNFDKPHRAKLPTLEPGDHVWIRSIWPCWRKKLRNLILLCCYRKRHTLIKLLCLSGYIHIHSDGTAQSYMYISPTLPHAPVPCTQPGPLIKEVPPSP